MKSDLKSGFTMPGETGCEDRVLELARLWGADALRDSDGTALPEKIRDSGYPLYSTICLIRGDNAFAKKNRDKLQQMFLSSEEGMAEGGNLVIELMKGFSPDAYEVNASSESVAWWQVFDRTAGEEIPRRQWSFRPGQGVVEIRGTRKWHRYTVSFLAFETWEFINRYNHQVNHWKSEPELPLDPHHPEVRARMKERLAAWLDRNGRTSVVRFTTFYWFNGLGGWGDYGRTVSPRALEDFSRKYGYRLTAETFVNKGFYQPLHQPPAREYSDWMEYVHSFFMETFKPFVDMVRERGKKAFFLLGDHWVGSEPLSKGFGNLGIHGVVKSVFNGFEVRIAGAVESVPVKEIRFHPYFFPKEVTGKPTFCDAGTPAEDLKTYWIDIRRACLRTHIHRIGFGGYVSLLDKFPDFVDQVTAVSREARAIADLYECSAPHADPVNVAVLNAWGARRAWMCSGHMAHNNVYNQFLESLSGLPVDVRFCSFDEVLKSGIPPEVNVAVNCGMAGTAWSGGAAWKNPALAEAVTEFVARGNGFIGIGEPSACEGMSRYFQLAPILGIDREPLRNEDNLRYDGKLLQDHFVTRDRGRGFRFVSGMPGLKVVSEAARVTAWTQTGEYDYFYEYVQPQIAVHPFQKGRSVYFSSFKYDPWNTRALHRALFWAAGLEDRFDCFRCDNIHTECAWFPAVRKLVVVNNSKTSQHTQVRMADGTTADFDLAPMECRMDVPEAAHAS